jgi:hypothetical protein
MFAWWCEALMEGWKGVGRASRKGQSQIFAKQQVMTVLPIQQ